MDWKKVRYNFWGGLIGFIVAMIILPFGWSDNATVIILILIIIGYLVGQYIYKLKNKK